MPYGPITAKAIAMARALGEEEVGRQVAPSQSKSDVDPGRLWRWLGLIGSNLFDAETTRRAVARGEEERNPLLDGIASNTPALFGLKAGVGAGESLLMDLLAKAGRKKAANIGASAITGVNTAVGINNTRKKDRNGR